jgi:hypothetical protein
LALVREGAIAAALVCGDPAMARAAKEAARVLLSAAGVQGAADAAKRGIHQPRQLRARGVPNTPRDRYDR